MHKRPCFNGSLPKEHGTGARLFIGCKVTTHGDPTVDEPQGRHVMDRRHRHGRWGSGNISGFVVRANRHGSHSTPKCREIHDERRAHQRRPRSLPMPSRRESREVGGRASSTANRSADSPAPVSQPRQRRSLGYCKAALHQSATSMAFCCNQTFLGQSIHLFGDLIVVREPRVRGSLGPLQWPQQGSHQPIRGHLQFQMPPPLTAPTVSPVGVVCCVVNGRLCGEMAHFGLGSCTRGGCTGVVCVLG